MQAQTLPAMRGWRWIIDGYRIYRKSSLTLALLVMGYWILMLLISSNFIPVIAQIACTIIVPSMSVVLMNECRRIDRGEKLTSSVLFSGFRENLQALISLGVIYTFLAFGMAMLTDNGAPLRLFMDQQQGGEAATPTAGMMLFSQLALILFIPLIMAYWFAPILVAWHRLPAGKALFFSFFACLRNWRAFLAYTLAALLTVLAPGILLGMVSSLAPNINLFPILVTLFFLFLVMPTLYASFYVSYRDVFGSSDENA